MHKRLQQGSRELLLLIAAKMWFFACIIQLPGNIKGN